MLTDIAARVDAKLRQSLQDVRLKAADTVELLRDGKQLGNKEVVKHLRDIKTSLAQIQRQVQAAPAEIKPMFERALGRLVSQYEPMFSDHRWAAAFLLPPLAKQPSSSAANMAVSQDGFSASQASSNQSRAPSHFVAAPKMLSAADVLNKRNDDAISVVSELRALQNPTANPLLRRVVAQSGEQSGIAALQREVANVLQAATNAAPAEAARLRAGLSSIRESFASWHNDAAWQQAFYPERSTTQAAATNEREPSIRQASARKSQQQDRVDMALSALSALRDIGAAPINPLLRRVTEHQEPQKILLNIQQEIARITTVARQAPAEQRQELLQSLQSIRGIFSSSFKDAIWQQAFEVPSITAPRTAPKNNPLLAGAAAQTSGRAGNHLNPLFRQTTQANKMSSAQAAPQARAASELSPQAARVPSDVRTIAALSASQLDFTDMDDRLAPVLTAAKQLEQSLTSGAPLNARALHGNIDDIISELRQEPTLAFRKDPLDILLCALESYRAQSQDPAWQRALDYRKDDMHRLAGRAASPPIVSFSDLPFVGLQLRKVEGILNMVAFPPRHMREARPGMIPDVEVPAFRTNNIIAVRNGLDAAIVDQQTTSAERQAVGRPRPEQDRAFGTAMLAMLKSYSQYLPDPQWQEVLSHRLGDIITLANREG